MFLASGCAITNTPLPELPPVRTLTLNPATLPDAFENSPYPSQFLSTVGGVPPLSSCTIVAGTFPAGLGLRVNASNRTQCEIFTETPPGQVTQAPGTYRFTIRAADSSAPLTDTEDYTIIVRPGFAINAFTLENGTEGRAFSQAITTTLAPGRGIPPLLADPNGCVATGLPAGLSIMRNPADTNGCVISGTPAAGSAAGSPYMVNVTLTDSSSPANIRMAGPIALTINPPLVMPVFALANGTQDRAYGPFTVTTTGGQPPVTCADGGTLPAGMGVAPSADGRNCVISGTPTVNGNFNVTISATDTATATTGTATVSQTVALVVNAPLDITSLILANGTVGRAYMGQLTNAGGQTPFAWSNPGGDLSSGACAGLSVDAAGMVTGTPTTAGTCVFTARVDDTATTTTAAGFDQDSVTITVNLALTITTLSFENGTVGRAFNAQFASTGGEAPFTWSNPGGDISAGACAGLALSAAGALTGAPTTAGVCMFTARVDDSGTATTPASFDQQTITINVNAALQITSLALGNGTVGRPFTQGMTNTGGQTPYTWTNPGGDLAAGACAGLAIAANGAVTGTPTTAGVCMFTGRVDDTATATTAAGFDQQTISITVNATLMITTASPLPDGVQNRAYNLALALSGGNAPFTWSSNIGSVVACNGLNLAADGTLSGTPATAGACMFTAQVDDTASTSTAAGNAMTAFTVTIQPPLVATLTQAGNGSPNAALFDGVLGRSYGDIGATPTWNVTGGLGGYTWCVFSGSIPGGLVGISTNCGAPTAAGSVTLSTSGGTITGATGVFGFNVRVFDTGNAAVAGGFASSPTLININPALVATENVGARVGNDITIPDAVEGRPYGNAPVDPTRVDYTMSASGGLAPYTLGSAFIGGTTPPAPFFCFQTPGTWTCHSSDGPINVGGAAASPFIFDLTFTDAGNPAVPNASVTVQHTLNTRVALAVAANMAPPDAVQGRTYGQNPLTPLIYTASGGLSAAGVNFTVPANQAAPGAGFPNGFACTPSAAMLTCGAAVSVTGTSGVYGPFNLVVDDTANATTPSSAATATSGAVAVTLNVNAPLTMPAVALDNGTQDRVFGPVNLPFTGGLTGFSCAGATLPTGMTVTGPVASACQLNNTPTVNGAFTPSATVTDTANASTPSGMGATGNMALTINAPLAITSVDADIPAAVTGAAYVGFQFLNSGGQSPFTWSNPGGTLGVVLSTTDLDCAGLSMNAAGMISGTSTAAAGTTCTFMVQVADTLTTTTAAGSTTVTRNIAIVDALQIVPFTPVGNGTQDRPGFSQIIMVVGGDGMLRNDPQGCLLAPGSGALPTGLSIARNPANSNECLISGTPTAAGTFTNITARASDQANSFDDEGPFTIVINAPLSLATFTLEDGTEGRAYGNGAGGAFQIAITGGEAPYTCSSSTLPSGVSVVVNGTNCDVSGTPNTGAAAAGPYTGTITVMDTASSTTAAGNDSESSGAPFNINVPLQFDSPMGLPDSVVGLAYNLVLQTSGGQAPRSISQVIGSALSNDADCAGLTFSQPSGTLGGAPTGATPVDNVCSFTAQVVDTATANSAAAGLGTVTQAFTINVQPAVAVTTTTMANARRTSQYLPVSLGGLPGVALTTTGGTSGTGRTWAVTSGPFTLNAGNWEGNAATACQGLTFPQAGAPNTTVTGTPVVAGTCSFTVTVTDPGNTATGTSTSAGQALSVLVLNTFAYAAGSTASVQVINTDTNDFVTSIGVGGGRDPDQVAVTRNGRYVYVTSPGTDEVTVIDASTNTKVTDINVGATCDQPRGVATTHSPAARAYVACAGTNAVVVIDANDASGTFNTVTATIPNVGSATGTPQRIAFTPDGTKAYVTITTTNEFSVISSATNTVTATDAFTNFGCTTPIGVVVIPDGTKAFVACQGDQKLVRIDVATDADDANTATQLGSTGAGNPDTVAVTPDGARLYISLGGGGGGLPEMSIVTVATLVVQGTVGSALSVPFVDSMNVGPEGGLDVLPIPLGVTIPPGATIEIFMIVNNDVTGNDPPNTRFTAGAAVFNDSPLAEGTNNPITFAAGTLPRGIAHIPIPR